MPKGVVPLSLLRVAEHRVRLTDLLEPLLRLLVSLVAVRVEFHGELAVRRLELSGRCLPLDPEHLVVIALHRGHYVASRVATTG